MKLQFRVYVCDIDQDIHSNLIFRYPQKFLSEISMRGDQFWNDIIALTSILLFLRILAYFLLRFKLNAVR